MRKIMITCEHGGNEIPAQYSYLFEGGEKLLRSHWGWDIGALDVATQLAKKFADFFFYAKISRLFVELNRSLHHKKLFSEITKKLDKETKEKILSDYYFPYRNNVEQIVQQEVKAGNQILHLSIHSFTPIFQKEIRKIDIGLLYDPSRINEKKFCFAFKKALLTCDSKLQIKSNKPYSGKSDGFVTYLRKKFDPHDYQGIELELNQKYLVAEGSKSEIIHALICGLKITFDH